MDIAEAIETESELEQKSTLLTLTYPLQDVVNLPLPRKRVVARFDMDIDFSNLPKRKPHVIIEPDRENAE